MNHKKNTEKERQTAAEMIKKIPYPSFLGIELVDLKFGEAVLKLEMRDQLRQPYGVLHGGATASLIDTATAFACISCLEEGKQTMTIDLTVHYLRPHYDGEVFCTAKVLRNGKKIQTVSAEVTNEEGKLIATALSTYMKI
jgi:uncharacterized protein (TIGR00369 family)